MSFKWSNVRNTTRPGKRATTMCGGSREPIFTVYCHAPKSSKANRAKAGIRRQISSTATVVGPRILGPRILGCIASASTAVNTALMPAPWRQQRRSRRPAILQCLTDNSLYQQMMEPSSKISFGSLRNLDLGITWTTTTTQFCQIYQPNQLL